MRRRQLTLKLAGAALGIGVAALPGCFSLGLGTRTTYVQESDETLGRISSLEARVSALEQTMKRFGEPVSVEEVLPVQLGEVPVAR